MNPSRIGTNPPRLGMSASRLGMSPSRLGMNPPRLGMNPSRVSCWAAVLGTVLFATAGALAARTKSAADAKAAPAAAAVCVGCHGAHGEGLPAGHIPRLAGQAADYLAKQLRDYASGARENPVMQNFAKPLSDADRTAVSDYYASLSAPYAAQSAKPTAVQLVRGHQLAFQGAEAKRVQACDNCHGPDGSGLPHSAPYLAGQSAEYLAAQLQAWQQGTRKNDGGKLMASVAAQLDDADIAAVTAYFGSRGTAND
jgi:cytochrome c553